MQIFKIDLTVLIRLSLTFTLIAPLPATPVVHPFPNILDHNPQNPNIHREKQ